MDPFDVYTVFLMLFQAGLILYATRMLPNICSRLRRAWRFFILALCGMFFSRVFFSMDCFNLNNMDIFIEAILTINSILMLLFLRLVSKELIGNRGNDALS